MSSPKNIVERLIRLQSFASAETTAEEKDKVYKIVTSLIADTNLRPQASEMLTYGDLKFTLNYLTKTLVNEKSLTSKEAVSQVLYLSSSFV